MQPALRLTPPTVQLSCTVRHFVYYPDAITIRMHTQAALDAGWAGVVLWALGYETPEVYKALANTRRKLLTSQVLDRPEKTRERSPAMAGSYIVAGARTPIGKMSGALASLSAAELGGLAIKAALERAGVAPEEVEHVLMGQVLMAGQGQVPSRQAAVKAGIPMSVPSVNINKVCLSGLNTIYLADQMIAAGEADIVIAGGMESMTNAPYLAAGARGGFRYGNTELADAIITDGLWCAFDACLMGLGTERYTAGGITANSRTRSR